MNGLRLLPRIALASALMVAIATSCREEDPVRTVANPGATPTMVTTGVDTYISDSGYVKYHAVTDIWEIYDDTVNPYWRFPHPLLIDIFAPGMKPNAHIECDSAYYLSQRRIFRFDGNVTAVNVLKDTFLTQQLYWDQTGRTFYTDSFIHIVKSDRVLEGYGFRSNEKMTEYRIKQPTAIIPASELEKGKEKNAANPDSAQGPYVDPLYRPNPAPASNRTGAPGTTPVANDLNRPEDRAPGLKR